MLEKTDFHKYLYLNCWWTLPAVIFINVFIIYAIYSMNNWKYIGAAIFYKVERRLYHQLQTYFLSVKETKCTGTVTFYVIQFKESIWWSTSPELMLKPMLPCLGQYFTPCLLLKCTSQLKTTNMEQSSKFLLGHCKFCDIFKMSGPRTTAHYSKTSSIMSRIWNRHSAGSW